MDASYNTQSTIYHLYWVFQPHGYWTSCRLLSHGSITLICINKNHNHDCCTTLHASSSNRTISRAIKHGEYRKKRTTASRGGDDRRGAPLGNTGRAVAHGGLRPLARSIVGTGRPVGHSASRSGVSSNRGAAGSRTARGGVSADGHRLVVLNARTDLSNECGRRSQRKRTSEAAE